MQYLAIDTDADATTALMHPIFFHITLPAALPRLSLLLGLSVAFAVIGLAALVRAIRMVLLALLMASCALALLIKIRASGSLVTDLDVTSFGSSLFLSIAVGSWFLARLAIRNEMAPADAMRWLGLSLIGGVLGARVGYFLINSNGWSFWRDIFNFNQGGLFGYGAYFGGLTGAALAARGDFSSFRKWVDVATPAVLFSTGLTRLGCYLQGCDYGHPLGPKAPAFLAVLGTFPRWISVSEHTFQGSPAWLNHVTNLGLSPDATASLPVHPTQLYESAFALLAALLAWVLLRIGLVHGMTFLSAVLVFGAGRFVLEFLRGDPERGLVSISHARQAKNLGSWSQIAALASMLVVALIWPKWRRGEKTLGQPGPSVRR
jgi:phosphatidylglycerol:prolipoprotein diacylglycerol transferase